jgi:hypothetical protein
MGKASVGRGYCADIGEAGQCIPQRHWVNWQDYSPGDGAKFGALPHLHSSLVYGDMGAVGIELYGSRLICQDYWKITALDSGHWHMLDRSLQGNLASTIRSGSQEDEENDGS